MSALVINMAGKKFASLTAIRPVGTNSSRGFVWLFLCDCGKSAELTGSEVRRGNIKSCPDCAAEIKLRAVTTHGKTKSPEYAIWSAMKRRCYNPGSYRFCDYGGRGIEVCSRWRESFEAFLMDMGKRPSRLHSIDRYPNNDGNYEPGNCRWATRKEQARNKRNNRKIIIDGVVKIAIDWALVAGISETGIRAREKRGLSGKELIVPSFYKT